LVEGKAEGRRKEEVVSRERIYYYVSYSLLWNIPTRMQ
jgi:hypothetical protein